MIRTLGIDEVKVVDRHRKDLGDLTELAESIKRIGLLHPVVVTTEHRLIAGERRLEACRLNGWDEIPVNEVDNFDDAKALLAAERDENTCRKSMTPSELVALGKALEAIERPLAVARQREGQSKGGRRVSGSLSGTGPRNPKEIRTRDVVGEALGVSGSTYQRARAVVEAAESGNPVAREALEEMDATGRITPAYRRLKQTGFDELASPDPGDNRRTAVEQRALLVRHYADKGNTSAQIAEMIALSPLGVRKIARRERIEIPADGIVGRHKKIDSHRIADQIVMALSHVLAGSDLIDWTSITKKEASEWVPILNDAIPEITTFVKKVKEISK